RTDSIERLTDDISQRCEELMRMEAEQQEDLGRLEARNLLSERELEAERMLTAEMRLGSELRSGEAEAEVAHWRQCIQSFSEERSRQASDDESSSEVITFGPGDASALLLAQLAAAEAEEEVVSRRVRRMQAELLEQDVQWPSVILSDGSCHEMSPNPNAQSSRRRRKKPRSRQQVRLEVEIGDRRPRVTPNIDFGFSAAEYEANICVVYLLVNADLGQSRYIILACSWQIPNNHGLCYRNCITGRHGMLNQFG
ncbi:unnamed protein product, partial [Polarella glacialis]